MTVPRVILASCLFLGASMAFFAGHTQAAGQACSTISPCPSGEGCSNSVCQTLSSTPSSGGLLNPLGTGTDLNALISSILKFVVQIGAVVVVLMLVYVGFLFVTARGEPGKITTARTALLWTVVGALILLGAQAIALAIQATANALSTGS